MRLPLQIWTLEAEHVVHLSTFEHPSSEHLDNPCTFVHLDRGQRLHLVVWSLEKFWILLSCWQSKHFWILLTWLKSRWFHQNTFEMQNCWLTMFPTGRNLLRGTWSVSSPLSLDLQRGLSPFVSLLPGSSSSFVLSRYHINPSPWFVIIFTKIYKLNNEFAVQKKNIIALLNREHWKWCKFLRIRKNYLLKTMHYASIPIEKCQ